MMERGNKFLPREDTDASHLLMESLNNDGVTIHLNSNVTLLSLEKEGREGKFPEIAAVIKNDHLGTEYELMFDCVLLATGRKPNIEDLNLEAAGVKSSP